MSSSISPRPSVSVVIPAYNNSRYLPQCVRSVAAQADEVIVVDDCSTDNTFAVAQSFAAEDPRVHPIRHDRNRGTLAARKTGVLASVGDWVLLVDQDDELEPGTIDRLLDYVRDHPADIVHYGVRVDAANEAAQQAAAGMTGFLNPAPRRLEGAEILRTQFAQSDGFDWHIHHKMFRGDLLRRAYALAPDTRLLLSDDLFMSFIVDSLASSYVAVPESSWYVYHLGRGDTFGAQLTVEAMDTMADRDVKALRLIRRFAESCAAGHDDPAIARDDWPDRVADVRDRLAEHTMNEWHDNLPESLQEVGLQRILTHFSPDPDAIAAELWRYVRDHAYALLVAQREGRGDSPAAAHDRAEAQRFRDMALRIEAKHPELAERSDPAGRPANAHYHDLRAVAMGHLKDTGMIEEPATAPAEQAAQPSRPARPTGLRALVARLFGR